MRVIAQIGAGVEVVDVSGMNARERSRNAKHLNAVKKLVEFESKGTGSQREYEKLIRQIERYEGKQTGGETSVEFANDPQAIIHAYLSDPESFSFEDAYVERAS